MSATISAERTIRQSGNSRVVSIPPLLLQAADLDEDADVTLSVADSGEIQIQRQKK